MKYLVSILTIFAFLVFSTDGSHTDLKSFLQPRTKKNEVNSFVDVIGGTEKVDEIKKIFGFDVVKALKALLNYERKTMVESKISIF